MATEIEADTLAIDGEVEALGISSSGNELKLVSDAVRALPPDAVKDLLSMGVCTWCIFRLFGVSRCVYSCTSLSTSSLSSTVEKLVGLEGHIVHNVIGMKENPASQQYSGGSELESNLCRICLGILQFVYRDNCKEMPVKMDCANDLALFITQVVKQEGHHIDNFSLEVSIPSIVTENEQEVWLCMKRKYDSELWFQAKFLADRLSAKDVLKFSITNPLETLLDIKSDLSSNFRIRLTYTHSKVAMEIPKRKEKKKGNKRMKTGVEKRDTIVGLQVASTEYSDFNGLHKNVSPHLSQVQSEKVIQPCSLTFCCSRTPVYIGGRYLKYSRNVSQTRWIIDNERKGAASIEEIIGRNILLMCQGDDYKFHAAGREDIDVRMLGSGRPFLVEIQNARLLLCEVSVKKIVRKINSLEDNLVKVKNVAVVGRQGWDLMREGEAEKQKEYAALVWISRSLEDDDLKILSSIKDMSILQRTPIRVLHRRSPLKRERVIHWMNAENIAGSCQYFLLHLRTQAGTYIKEFVHGDLGRTHPSIGSILGCRAEILQLDVTDVKMDCFLTE